MRPCKKRSILSVAAGLTIVMVVTSGCASPASSSGMRPKTLNIKKQHPYSVQIKVGGGRATNPMWMSQISDKAFAQALTEAIVSSKVFSEVKQTPPADYLLDVQITNVEQPAMGFNMTVYMETAWQLIKTETGAPVLRTPISSSYTAGMGEAFVGVERLKRATEGAARDNIAKGLTKISSLAL